MAKDVEIKSSEAIALELGTVGFEGAFANGQAHKGWAEARRLSSIPGMTEEEKTYIDEVVKPLCEKMDDWEIWSGDEKMISAELLNEMKEAGLWGICMPKDKNGLGFSEQAHGAIVQMMASRSFAGAIPMMVVNSLGPGKFILAHGSDRQKEEVLPLIASGHYTTCFGATETRAASDIFATETTGTLEKDENGELYIDIKNAEKRYITLAPIANLLGVAFKLEDPHDYLGTGNKDIGSTFGLVKRDTPGLEVDKRLSPNGVPFPNGVIQGSFKLSVSDVIGEETGFGKGERMMQEALAKGRGVTLTNGATAALKKAAYTVGAFVGARAQFGRTLKDMESLNAPLAQTAASAYLADAVSRVGAKTVDDGGMPSISAGISKNLLVDMMKDGLMETARVFCGKGVMDGPSNVINREIRSILVADAVEGAHHVSEWANGIQGLMRTHNHARHVIPAAIEIGKGKGLGGKVKAAAKNSTTLAKHAVPMVGNTVKNWGVARMPDMFHGATQGDVDPQMQRYYRHINRMSRSYNMVGSMALMHHQNGLVGRGNTLKRLGRIMGYNYAASCALSEFEAKGRPDEERDLLHWAVQHCMFKAEQAFEELLDNYPKSSVKHIKEDGFSEKVSEKSELMSIFMKASYNPRARDWKPDDVLEHRISRALTQPGSKTREIMGSGIYIPTDTEKEPIAIFDDALEKWADVREIMITANREKRKYTAEEVETIREAEIAQARMVAVDEFDLDMNLVRTAAEHTGYAAHLD